MRVWFAAKTEERRDIILNDKIIPLGGNVSTDELLAHVSLTPFKRGGWALDVIGADTNEAWIFELELPDSIHLYEDPSGDGVHYLGDWRVSKNPIPIEKIISEVHIPDVQAWESGE